MKQPLSKLHRFNLDMFTNVIGGTILICKVNNQNLIFEVANDFVDNCYGSVPVERGSTLNLTACYMSFLDKNSEHPRLDKKLCSYPTAKEFYCYKNFKSGI